MYAAASWSETKDCVLRINLKIRYLSSYFHLSFFKIVVVLPHKRRC
jgi:hypothetical protein